MKRSLSLLGLLVGLRTFYIGIEGQPQKGLGSGKICDSV
jgi:hypothetical protein